MGLREGDELGHRAGHDHGPAPGLGVRPPAPLHLGVVAGVVVVVVRPAPVRFCPLGALEDQHSLDGPVRRPPLEPREPLEHRVQPALRRVRHDLVGRVRRQPELPAHLPPTAQRDRLHRQPSVRLAHGVEAIRGHPRDEPVVPAQRLAVAARVRPATLQPTGSGRRAAPGPEPARRAVRGPRPARLRRSAAPPVRPGRSSRPRRRSRRAPPAAHGPARRRPSAARWRPPP